MNLKYIAIFLNLITHIIVYQFAMTGMTLKSNEIPAYYKFLLFPKENTTISISNPLNNTTKRKLGRAVTATYSEISRGTIKVIIDENSYGNVHISALSFLPQDENNLSQYITAWQKYLQIQGYTQGSFTEKEMDNGNSVIKLKLSDSKHSRAEIYRYETDGNNICYVKTVAFPSGIVMVLFGFSFLVTTIIILLSIKVIRWSSIRSMVRESRVKR